MEILKLNPVIKDYIWGGTNLRTVWGKQSNLKILAEAWELSVHKDGKSTICGGKFGGQPLADILTKEMLGKNCDAFDSFPILIKLIDAKEKLSVQVHPKDEYALKNENDLGKTEMWYIADCREGAGIYLGFNKQINREKLKQGIENGTVESLLNFIPVKKGDSFLIEAGTIHAICGGVTICEIQQNSNVTYRVFDYNRTGADGKKRELHINKALDVINYVKFDNKKTIISGNILASCKYFTVKKYKADGIKLNCTNESFNAVNIMEGSGFIEKTAFKKGDTFFIPAGYGTYFIDGNCEFLLTYI